MASDPAGRNMTYWASVNGSRALLQAEQEGLQQVDAFRGDGTEVANWKSANFTLPSGDGNPFLHPLQPHRSTPRLRRQLLQSEHVAPGNQRQRRALLRGAAHSLGNGRRGVARALARARLRDVDSDHDPRRAAPARSLRPPVSNGASTLLDRNGVATANSCRSLKSLWVTVAARCISLIS